MLEGLREWLSKAERLAIIGVGNPLLMDDSVGIRAVQDLRGNIPRDVLLIECETTPENYLEEIAFFRPTHVLLIDAAMLNLKPGEMALFEPEKLRINSTISTHFIPLRIFCEYIERVVGAEVKLLLIQPKRVDFGEELTAKVLSSKEKIVRFLLSALTKGQKGGV